MCEVGLFSGMSVRETWLANYWPSESLSWSLEESWVPELLTCEVAVVCVMCGKAESLTCTCGVAAVLESVSDEVTAVWSGVVVWTAVCEPLMSGADPAWASEHLGASWCIDADVIVSVELSVVSADGMSDEPAVVCGCEGVKSVVVTGEWSDGTECAAVEACGRSFETWMVVWMCSEGCTVDSG